MGEAKKTVLAAVHESLGASFTDFGGWLMPLKYGSELAEHKAVRERAGLFDLSHMGEIRVTGRDAAVFLNTALVGDLAAVSPGRAKYSLICDERGGIIDDLICYRLGEQSFLVVPNAGNTDTVMAEFVRRSAGFDVLLRNVSAETCLLALQGPLAEQVLLGLVSQGQRALLCELKYYAAAEAVVADVPVLLARTGYTGEDGFELYVDAPRAEELWGKLARAGQSHGVLPVGLATRDSLRLEAGMPLYGNELSLEVNPFEAGLGAVVSFKKEERFVGRDVLERLQGVAPSMQLVGLKGLGRRAARAGYQVFSAGVPVGRVSSGQPSPTLGYPVALAFVEPGFAAVGGRLDVDLRGKAEPFEVVSLPFYRRAR